MADENGTPKIMDFTAYFDVFRLYEGMMKREVQKRRRVSQEIVERLR